METGGVSEVRRVRVEDMVRRPRRGERDDVSGRREKVEEGKGGIRSPLSTANAFYQQSRLLRWIFGGHRPRPVPSKSKRAESIKEGRKGEAKKRVGKTRGSFEKHCNKSFSTIDNLQARIAFSGASEMRGKKRQASPTTSSSFATSPPPPSHPVSASATYEA